MLCPDALGCPRARIVDRDRLCQPRVQGVEDSEVPACGTGAGTPNVEIATSPSLTSTGWPPTQAQCQTMIFGAELPVPSTGEWAATM